MAITIPVATKNSKLDLLVDKIDLGSTNASGQVWLKNAAGNVLVKLAMSNPAFGDAAIGTVDANAITDGIAILAGTCTKFSIVDRDEVEVLAGSVTAVGGGGDLESTTSSTAIIAGETVSISSLTLVAGG